MKYKLICIDMDGTLLNSNHKISKISKSTLRKAHDMGVHVVISTGRTYVDAVAYSDFIGLNSPIIACTGAIIKEKHGDDVIYKSVIDEEACKKLLKIFNKYNVKPIFNSVYKIYCGDLKLKIGIELLKIRGFINRNVKLNYIKDEEKWFDVFNHEKDNIIKCEIINRNREKIHNLRKELESVSEIEITSSSNHNIEITKKGTSKGKAIEILANYYNIKKEEIIAIGDSDNDLSAIEFAGMGVAMGNANEKVKKKSNFVTDSNDNNGVAKVIVKFILEKLV
ncbi:putative phosphatase YwpJ [Clostridium puniceum]|uniref:Putative phosphatase YwpJ n=1 Tax=Clostridium puniceum TaxID=29367 RepID=A0A1S8TCD1_9CLOT|nr:Cof-type HAD-IIB family hydrolase [Clostridium puniceum]OOM75269.1 putative phosphatase YwpJ [Clostridium puniceum]